MHSKEQDIMNRPASIFGLSRHRLQVDGMGVTTLVTFMGCPLHCRYCLNDICHKSEKDLEDEGRHINKLTPQELYDKVKIDNLYFLATNGGITFGGGEPALQYDFIKDFRQICGWGWKLNIETSLNYPLSHLQELLPLIDHLIIDIKDSSPTIYSAYTGTSNEQVMENLAYLKETNNLRNTTIRVPHIPNYNTDLDVQATMSFLASIGCTNIEEFTYIITERTN